MAVTFDQIGAEKFIVLAGGIDPVSGVILEEITRPGVSGSAYRSLGNRGDPYQLRGISDVTSSANAKTLITTYKAFQGTVISVIYREQTFTSQLVLSFQHINTRQVATAVGGINDGNWLVESQWILRHAGT